MERTSLFAENMREFERRYLVKELERHGWNRTRTASELGISRRTLMYKLARLQIVQPSPEEQAS